MKAQINIFDEIIVDNFAGGGGASTGIELATGRPVAIAVNHDPDAVLMHKTNHPYTQHYCESVWDVDPVKVCAGRPVGLAWFSPDCKHFSKAKGGKPVSKKIRGLAWIVLRWAALVHPRVIMLENVEEFKTWGPVRKGKSVKKKVGLTFLRWKSQLEALGYVIETRELRACDYGAPTIRKRFFAVARRDGKPIVWPESTHGDPKSEAVRSGKLKPWRTAAEIIDWSLPCPSIFDSAEEIYTKHGLRAQRPLAEATMRRIARGIKKFVIENPAPFIVGVNHTTSKGNYDFFRGQGIDEPYGTVTARNGNGVIIPTLAPWTVTNTTNSTGHSVNEPIDTVRTGGGGGQMLIAPTMIQYHGEQSATEVRGQSIERPVMTIDSSGRYGMVSAFLSKYYDGGYQGAGNSAEKPLNTITAIDHNAIIASSLCILRNNCTGQKTTEPLHTIATSPGHFAEIRAFLIKYYGQGSGQDLHEPLHTATAQDRFGIVTVAGTEYAIVDIGLRMLTPRELFAANGFPPDYIIDRDYTGKEYTKAKQVARCGNAVPPQFAEALVRANLPEMCGGKIETMAEFERQVAI